VVAASLWWTYFDLTGAATTHTLSQRAGHRSSPLHDIYAYGHWPIALGLTAAGVGLEEAILHGNQPSLPTGARWILAGGISACLGCHTGWRRWRAVLPLALGERV
jgi:low temperature requirement protein LtrA